MRGIIRNLFENQTWWNLFYHYKHGNVYEIRVPSGHGMRWSGDGEMFIGFWSRFYEVRLILFGCSFVRLFNCWLARVIITKAFLRSLLSHVLTV